MSIPSALQDEAYTESARTECEACGGADLRAMMEVVDETGYSYEMVRCPACGLCQVSRTTSQGNRGAWPTRGTGPRTMPAP